MTTQLDEWMDDLKFIDDDNYLDQNRLEGELSDAEFEKRAKQQVKERDARAKGDHSMYGNDGTVEVFSKLYIYKGWFFNLKVIRYFAGQMVEGSFELSRGGLGALGPISSRFDSFLGMNVIGKHVVIEYEERSKSRVEKFSRSHKWSEFLWHDSLHVDQETWSLRDQIRWVLQLAIDDIDSAETGR